MNTLSKIIKLAITLIIMAMSATQISSCNSNDNITSVSALEFDKEIKANSVQLLDVRTPQEYAEGHIDGAFNINIQSDDFQQRAEKELSKDSTILVYCRSGRRSMEAAEMLTKLGYNCVGSDDGIASWRTMQNRLQRLSAMGIPTEFHVYEGLEHGFGIGTGTVAEGWIKDAIKFWEANMKNEDSSGIEEIVDDDHGAP